MTTKREDKIELEGQKKKLTLSRKESLLPSVEELAKYKKIDPKFPTKILNNFIEESNFRREATKLHDERQYKITIKAINNEQKLPRLYSFIVMMVLMVLSFTLIMFGKETAGFFSGGVSVALLAMIFFRYLFKKKNTGK